MDITRREAVAALMTALYGLPHVNSVTPVTSDTLFILITVNDGIEFDTASMRNMREELDEVREKCGCPNLSVMALYGGRIYSICGPLIPEMNVLPKS